MAHLSFRPRRVAIVAAMASTGLALGLGWPLSAVADPRAGRGGEATPDPLRVDRGLHDVQTSLRDLERKEQEHFDQLRHLLLERKDATAATGAPGPETSGAGAPSSTAPSAAQTPTPAVRLPVMASVSGRVNVKGALHDVYVYLEGFRSNAGRKAELEIVQRNKAFEPAFAVALAGTRATFPNRDTFFHNVFSLAPVPFDLGTYRADESSPGVLLTTPGIVDVYCNIHAQMHAQILVVPNRVFARVADDGTFRLDHVPVGHRKLVAWGPNQRPSRIEVTVPTGGAHVSFDLEPDVGPHHSNKFGLPYGAYRE